MGSTKLFLIDMYHKRAKTNNADLDLSYNIANCVTSVNNTSISYIYHTTLAVSVFVASDTCDPILCHLPDGAGSQL